MGDSEAEFLTPAEVALLLGVAPVTVRAWAGRDLKAERVTPGGHRRFARSEVLRFAHARGMALPTAAQALRRILLVDDDPQTQHLLCDFLDAHGVLTATASDGFEVGFKLASFHPDLVLLTLVMPGLDGLDVCRRIKAETATQATRVVILSGPLSHARRDEAHLAGAEQCLAKPLELAALGAALGLSAPAASHG